MAAKEKIFGVKVRFGLYFLNKFQEETESENVQVLFERFKDQATSLLPKALQIAHNTVKENKNKISFEDACDLIDEFGGIGGDEIMKFQESLVNSLGVKDDVVSDAKSKEGKPSKKK